ncbi:hypothetical protein OAN12_07205, partial [Halioglobus sp.]|nr:hypothetical protein [Halioglobus sp.]
LLKQSIKFEELGTPKNSKGRRSRYPSANAIDPKGGSKCAQKSRAGTYRAINRQEDGHRGNVRREIESDWNLEEF